MVGVVAVTAVAETMQMVVAVVELGVAFSLKTVAVIKMDGSAVEQLVFLVVVNSWA